MSDSDETKSPDSDSGKRFVRFTFPRGVTVDQAHETILGLIEEYKARQASQANGAAQAAKEQVKPVE